MPTCTNLKDAWDPAPITPWSVHKVDSNHKAICVIYLFLLGLCSVRIIICSKNKWSVICGWVSLLLNESYNCFEYFNEKGHSFDMWDSELYPYVYYVESIVFVCYLLYIFTSIKDTCNHRWSRSKPASEPHCKTSQSLKSSYWQNVGFFLFPKKL